MKERRNNNSLLVLTTLGVYLGLLMVGATPGVVAQQGAMSRNFELSEEVDLKDDLDLDPAAEQEADEIAEFEHLFTESSVESLVSVYLVHLALDSHAVAGTQLNVAVHHHVVPQPDLTQRSAHWPNDVLNSPSTNISSLARAAL
ncbi:MAG: hypothetical protein H0V76_09795 [Blastocatellia bacterium]|nr:hypothetical protein [Blastocatellia bacterium]